MKKLSPKYLAIFVLCIAVAGFAFMQISNKGANAQAEQGGTGTNIADVKDAWDVRCDEPAEGEAKESEAYCEIVQRLSITETGQRLIELAIGYPGDSETARGVFILPTGILLEPGVKIVIDDNAPFSFRVRYCLPDGCFGFINLNDDVLKLFREGSVAKVILARPNAQNLEIQMPLSGFSKALDQLG